MNLSMDVLRWLTVRAIRGRTWAMDRVFDSPSTPADIRTATEREPFISVYCDDSTWGGEGREFGAGLHDLYPGTSQLVIEVGVASPRYFNENDDPVEPGTEGAHMVTQLNATDEGLEAQIGLISRQAMDALMSTNETNPWAELWRELVAGQVTKVQILRGGPSGEGDRAKPRYASRVTIITCGTLGEPMRGEELDRFPFWKKFFDACDGDEEFEGLATLVRAHIERPTGTLPDWRLAQKYLTITEAGARSLGIAPVAGFDVPTPFEHPAGPIDRISLSGEGGLGSSEVIPMESPPDE